MFSLQLAFTKQVNVNTFRLSLSVLSQVPTASVFVDGAAALNRVRWSHTGKEIATGDSEGQVQVFDVGEVSSSLRRCGYISLEPAAPLVGLGVMERLRSSC